MITSMTDLDDFVRGSTLYGTGGGGPQVLGKQLLLGSFEEGKDLSFTSIDDLPDDAWVCTAFYMGSIAPLTPEEEERKADLGLVEKTEPRVLVPAVRELEKELGIEIAAIVPVELGGLNCPAPVDAAAQMGKKLVDGDLAGRAVPEVAQTTPRLLGYPITPISCCDAWGNVSMIRQTHSYDVAELLGKMLSIPAFEPIGLACFAMTVADAKRAVVPGTMTRNIATGAAVRQAREEGRDPAQAFADVAGGTVVFRGEVSRKDWESKGGYMYVDLFVAGAGDWAGRTFKIWVKNENHLSWIDDELFITSPDLLQCVLEDSGEPLTNTDIAVGDHVAVVAVPNPAYRTPEGIKVLGPYHYGFKDLPYVPMEERLGQRA